MLFSVDAWPGIADGSITLTFRTWSRPQARAGGRYRVGGMLLEVGSADRVRAGDITDADAQRAGAADRAALLARLGAGARTTSHVVVDDETEVWRVEFRCVGRDDRAVLREHAVLSDAELDAIRVRLARLDGNRPWTRRVLELIRDNPAVVSTELAARAGQERAAFKLDVRKLKELGLTESLDVGYRLSPRGEAVLRSLAE